MKGNAPFRSTDKLNYMEVRALAKKPPSCHKFLRIYLHRKGKGKREKGKGKREKETFGTFYQGC